MALSRSGIIEVDDMRITIPPTEVFRVIDDCDCILTTLDARRALLALMKIMDEHDVHVCWAEREELK